MVVIHRLPDEQCHATPKLTLPLHRPFLPTPALWAAPNGKNGFSAKSVLKCSRIRHFEESSHPARIFWYQGGAGATVPRDLGSVIGLAGRQRRTFLLGPIE
jgi:hypothetical protein